MLESVGGVLILALFLIWWRLGSLLAEMESLNNKAEIWGKGIDGSLSGIQTMLNELDAEVSSATSVLQEIAARAREHLPTERETNRGVAP